MTENVQFWLAGLCLGVLILTALLEHEKRFDYSAQAQNDHPAERITTVARKQ